MNSANPPPSTPPPPPPVLASRLNRHFALYHNLKLPRNCWIAFCPSLLMAISHNLLSLFSVLLKYIRVRQSSYLLKFSMKTLPDCKRLAWVHLFKRILSQFSGHKLNCLIWVGTIWIVTILVVKICQNMCFKTICVSKYFGTKIFLEKVYLFWLSFVG